MAATPPPPETSPRSTLLHRVGFVETDAMGVVHHSNYLRYFEAARVKWLQEHDQPYTAYMEMGLNFAVTNAEVAYHRSARFDDPLEITVWMRWVRGASLAMEYQVLCREALIASGRTEHAAVDAEGKVRRIPRERLQNLRGRVPEEGES